MIRSLVAACSGLLAALILQAPAVAVSGATNDSSLAPILGIDAAQTPPAAPHSSPEGKPTPASRGPNGQRGGPDRGPGSGTGLTEERWQWWNDSDVKQQLGLREDTVRTINTIVRDRQQKYFPVWKSMTAEFEKLNRMTSDPTVDETSYEAQATKVYFMQSQLDTSRTVMNFRIYKLLRSDQLKKLEEIVQRRSARSGRDRGPGPR